MPYLGVRKGVALHFGLKGKLPTPKQMQELTEHWRVSYIKHQ